MSMEVKTVKWRDSRMYITQSSLEEIEGVCEITSVGFVVDERTDCIVLAGDLVDGEYRRVLVIPKENIIK